MGFSWTAQTVQWFADASAYTGFHQNLAKELLPDFSDEDTVFDFGCGLGRLDLALSPYIKALYGFDVSEPALQNFQEEIFLQHIQNITVLHKDVATISQSCDVGIMSFFGRSHGEMAFYRKKCKKKLIRIINTKNQSTLYPALFRQTSKDTYEIVKIQLEENHYSYKFKEITLEFGQPFRSNTDAHAFLKNQAPSITAAEINDFLEENLQQTNNVVFPFYLPNQKSIGVFTIF